MRAVFIAVAVLASSSVHAEGKGDLLTGTPTIVDGDTFDLGSDRVRIWGNDAPESGACCQRLGKRWCPAQEAADALMECAKGTTVTCRVQKVQRPWRSYWRKRYVSECWRDDNKQDIAACMVRRGWATDYTYYSSGHYLPLEAEPKSKKEGLWQCDDPPGPPTKRWGRKGEGVFSGEGYKPSGSEVRSPSRWALVFLIRGRADVSRAL